ncbi:UNVERIFIED_CONTAM: hypothetical protein Sangu_2772900 [Sesamum angustifolium]|uniref:Uncharacterized protein n=1 Tax=Sesamum angustifolium TaxID=2727405 RepID=A0AAW2IUR9_9LAMI
MKALPITYLGAALYKGNKRKVLYENLIDKVRNRISGWEHCHLSYVSRLQLIKTVLASMPIYLLQVLNPPVSTIQKLERLFAKFLWGSTTEQWKIHWTKWHTICYPTEEGGLGIRNLRDMVTAFSYKLWWRLKLNSSLWSTFTISKYCQGYFSAISKLYTMDLSIWKRLCMILKEAQGNIFWSLVLVEGSLDNLVGTQCNFHIPVNWFWNNQEWDILKLQQAVPQHMIEQITGVPINTNQPDCLYWKLSKDGAFTTKST